MGFLCSDCGASYSVEPEEAEWLKEKGKDSPSQCPRCRAFQSGLQDESIVCTECGRVFIYPRELKLFAETFGWPRPLRCLRGCAKAGDAENPPDVEYKMFDLLKRLRTAQRGASTGSTGVELARSSFDKRRNSRSSSSSMPHAAAGADGAPASSDSLSAALKAFQDKKRRRHRH